MPEPALPPALAPAPPPTPLAPPAPETHKPAEHDWPEGHGCMHAPQFSESVRKFVHAPWQRVVPNVQPHAPRLHCVEPVHLFVQKPQLSGSLIVSAQLLSGHCIRPVGHVATQAPAAQYGVAPEHALPHVPQFFASEVVFTQTLLQFLSVPVQVQVPASHVERSGQTLLQVPQFFSSVCPSKHDVMVELGSRQEIWGNAHVAPVPLPPLPPAGLPPLDIPPWPELVPPSLMCSGVGAGVEPQLTTRKGRRANPKANRRRMSHLWSIPRGGATRSALFNLPFLQEFAGGGIGPRF